MIKRLLYVFWILMIASLSSNAKSVCSNLPCVINITPVNFDAAPVYFNAIDTAKVKKDPEDKKKIKEIPTARRQSKPEKLVLTPVDTLTNKKVKPPRQRRPDGLMRPPEIPRRNNN
jgi:hypothetical protein